MIIDDLDEEPDEYYEDLNTETGATALVPAVPLVREPRSQFHDRAKLVVLRGQGTGKSHVIADGAIIGRSPEAPVQLLHDDVSRQHAQIKRTGPGTFTLRDLGSRNGTMVNGVPIETQVLNFGDMIRVGAKAILLFTQHDEAEDRLLQSQKMESIGRLASGVAHDFKNLLCTILGYADFIRQKNPPDDLVDSLAAIQLAAERGVELTRQLLGFARGGVDEHKPVDIAALLDEVRLLIKRTVNPNITVKLQVERGTTALGAPSQLHQVLMNLCINACDAMPTGGQLSLSSERILLGEADMLVLPQLAPGPYIVITVGDTGHGMSAETMRHIFEPFYTTKEAGKGTGMGLAIVYGIVNNHGGQIEVESKVGGGSVFRVHLPAAGATQEKPEQTMTMVVPSLALVVDPDEKARGAVQRLLEDQGLGMFWASSSAEALKMFEQHAELIEIVLFDLGLPGADPAAMLHALRRIKPAVQVLLTGSPADKSSARALLAAGADGFLQKPYDSRAISDAVAKVKSRQGGRSQ
jgi:two-component system, cell cycle sensor histidine kinase and response regulator CckA